MLEHAYSEDITEASSRLSGRVCSEEPSKSYDASLCEGLGIPFANYYDDVLFGLKNH